MLTFTRGDEQLQLEILEYRDHVALPVRVQWCRTQPLRTDWLTLVQGTPLVVTEIPGDNPIVVESLVVANTHNSAIRVAVNLRSGVQAFSLYRANIPAGGSLVRMRDEWRIYDGNGVPVVAG